MGKKNKPAVSGQPTAKVAPAKKGSPPAASQGTEKKVGASPQIIFAMGMAGAALGFLSGLNLWPAVPENLTSLIANSSWLAGILGQQHLDYLHAGQGLFLGLSVGLGSAFSFNLPMRKMVMTWMLAGGGLLAGALLLKSAAAAAVGWVIGLVAAQATPA